MIPHRTSSKIWPGVTKENPCPVCGHHDWCCRFGSFKMLCLRVESLHPCSGGGWYHDYGTYTPPRLPALTQRLPARKIDAFSIIRSWQRKTTLNQQEQLAASLGVNLSAIQQLNAAYCEEKRAWGFPMKDGEEKTIGIRLRNDAGLKWAVTGSRQGLFIPDMNDFIPFLANNKICYLPEGPTSTAALLSIGLFAVGRPNCMTGHEHLKVLLSRLGIRKVVIMAEYDGIKQNGKRPGVEGALKLRKDLGLKSVLWIPPSPCKDVRDFLAKGGTKEAIENEVSKKVWSF